MRNLQRGAAVVALLAVATAQPARSQGIDDDQLPSFLPFAYPPDGAHMMGETHPDGRVPGAGTPGVTTPLVSPAPKAAPAAPRTQAQVLDELFGRLAAATDDQEASGLAARIQRLWLESGSATVDLLVARADAAAGHGDTRVAEQLLDKVVVLDPKWAAGWNKRATLRFLSDDDDGAMADIAHVLAIEPRHFGALSGMAVILQRHGFKKEALGLLRKAAALYPHNDDLAKMIDTLAPDVEGRPI